MSGTKSKPTYTVTMEALPDASDPEGIHRLRSLLKTALRSFRRRWREARRLSAGIGRLEASGNSPGNNSAPPV